MERGRDEVRVMTVHGAKGLEADIVILPDTTRSPTAAARSGGLLYTDDGVLFPAAEADAPEAVLAAKETAKQEMLRENRRLLYVALTRARDRLYICGFETKKGVDPNSWYKLACDAAQAIGKQITRGDETLCVVGDPDTQTQSRERAVPDSSKKPLPDWIVRPPREEPARPRLLRPSDLLEDEPPPFSPVGPHGAKRFQRGLFVHALLARLPEIAPADREEAARCYLRRRNILPEDAEPLIQETLRVLSDPVFAPAFAPDSRAEMSLVAELPELGAGMKVSGRVDRLAVTAEDVLVVDFKTNRPPPEVETGVAQPFIRQMAIYRTALRKIFPERRVICGLVWTDGPRLMLLSDALLDDALVRLMARTAAPAAA